MSIAVSNLTKMYGSQKAVDQLSFSVQKGEVVGFLGPNGAGKSTTMKILTGYLPPSSGIAKVCDMEVDQHPLEIKRKIGYLPESNPLYSEMYVKEILSFTAGFYQMDHKTKRIEDVIDLTGLRKECHKKIGALSKGYRQRVGLARALLPDPEVLILDEPTSGLDPNQLSEIRALIVHLGREKTVLLSSHIMQEIEAVCERAIIIHQGKIVADDTMESLGKESKEKILRVVFEQKVDRSLLEKLNGVEEISSKSAFVWHISTRHPEEMKKSLWQFTLQNNLNIVSLQSSEASLEELFRKLTN